MFLKMAQRMKLLVLLEVILRLHLEAHVNYASQDHILCSKAAPIAISALQAHTVPTMVLLHASSALKANTRVKMVRQLVAFVQEV